MAVQSRITNDLIGQCIRVAMAKRNIGTTALAKLLGVSPASVRLYRQGEINDIRRLDQVANALDLSLAEMMSMPG